MKTDFSITSQTVMVSITMDVDFATVMLVVLYNYSVMKLVIANVKIIQSDRDVMRVH